MVNTLTKYTGYTHEPPKGVRAKAKEETNTWISEGIQRRQGKQLKKGDWILAAAVMTATEMAKTNTNLQGRRKRRRREGETTPTDRNTDSNS